MNILVSKDLSKTLNEALKNLSSGKCILIFKNEETINIDDSDVHVIELKSFLKNSIELLLARKRKVVCVVDVNSGLKNLTEYLIKNIEYVIIPERYLNKIIKYLDFLKNTIIEC